MLFRWNFDFRFGQIDPDDQSFDFLPDLLRAHRKGSHLVVLDRRVVSYLIRRNGQSESDIALLNRISSEYTQNGNIYNKSKRFIDIVYDGLSKPLDDRIINLPFRDLNNSNVLSDALFVTENISADGFIYEFIINSTKDILGLSSVNFELQHGGGDDIDKVVAYHVGKKRIVYSVIDSDRDSPNGIVSGKLRRLENLGDKWPLAFVDHAPCRELENILPEELIFSIPSGKFNQTNKILQNIIEKEDNNKCYCKERYHLYFDFKKGINIEIYKTLSESDKKWVKDKLSLVSNEVMELTIPISGYGENIVEQIRSNGQHTSMLRSLIRQNRWIELFSDFVSDLGWVFVANRPVRT